MGVHAILVNGHVRVGLGDNIYFRKGELASNELLIKRMVDLSRALGREMPTHSEAREILKIEGMG